MFQNSPPPVISKAAAAKLAHTVPCDRGSSHKARPSSISHLEKLPSIFKNLGKLSMEELKEINNEMDLTGDVDRSVVDRLFHIIECDDDASRERIRKRRKSANRRQAPSPFAPQNDFLMVVRGLICLGLWGFPVRLTYNNETGKYEKTRW